MWRRASSRSRLFSSRFTKTSRSYGNQVAHHDSHGHHVEAHGHGHGHGHQDLAGCTFIAPIYNSPNAKDELKIIFGKPALLIAVVVGADFILGRDKPKEEHPYYKLLGHLREFFYRADLAFADFILEQPVENRSIDGMTNVLQTQALKTKKFLEFLKRDHTLSKPQKYRNPQAIIAERQGRFRSAREIEAALARSETEDIPYMRRVNGLSRVVNGRVTGEIV